MRKELFNELVQSVREAGAIVRGKAKPSREFKYTPKNVRQIRRRLHLSQDKFAEMMGISVGTLRNWEQGRRKPQGPAKVLLNIASHHPDIILETTQHAA